MTSAQPPLIFDSDANIPLTDLMVEFALHIMVIQGRMPAEMQSLC